MKVKFTNVQRGNKKNCFIIDWKGSPYLTVPLLSFAHFDSLANKFPRRFCVVFARDWLGSLIHIHSNRRVLRHISICLLSSGDALFAVEGQFYSWRKKMLGAART